jgi:hypothetical protein
MGVFVQNTHRIEKWNGIRLYVYLTGLIPVPFVRATLYKFASLLFSEKFNWAGPIEIGSAPIK